MPHRAFIGIGTNLGDRLANYLEALERIGKLRQTRVVRQSSIYETEPVGDVAGGPFLNGAVEVETELPSELLMHQLLAIERSMGRKREPDTQSVRARPLQTPENRPGFAVFRQGTHRYAKASRCPIRACMNGALYWCR